jgi:hypothetical protein
MMIYIDEPNFFDGSAKDVMRLKVSSEVDVHVVQPNVTFDPHTEILEQVAYEILELMPREPGEVDQDGAEYLRCQPSHGLARIAAAIKIGDVAQRIGKFDVI